MDIDKLNLLNSKELRKLINRLIGLKKEWKEVAEYYEKRFRQKPLITKL